MGSIKQENIYENHGDYILLKLHSEKFGDFEVKLDCEDEEKAKVYHWCVSRVRDLRCGYEIFYIITSDYKHKGTLLHRFLSNCPKGMVVDHIDGDPMNNRKVNLRICTLNENNINRKMNKNNKTGHKGILYMNDDYVNKWHAYIRINTKRICLGYFSTYEEAVQVREDAEKKYQGEFARDIN